MPIKRTSWDNSKAPNEAYPFHCLGSRLSFLLRSDDYSTYATQVRMRIGLAKMMWLSPPETRVAHIKELALVEFAEEK